MICLHVSVTPLRWKPSDALLLRVSLCAYSCSVEGWRSLGGWQPTAGLPRAPGASLGSGFTAHTSCVVLPMFWGAGQSQRNMGSPGLCLCLSFLEKAQTVHLAQFAQHIPWRKMAEVTTCSFSPHVSHGGPERVQVCTAPEQSSQGQCLVVGEQGLWLPTCF